MICRIAGGLIFCRLALLGTAPASAHVRPLIGVQHSVKVQRHATLLKIARQFEVNPQILARINHIKHGYIKPGRLLFLPTLHILPEEPEDGIVLNVPERQVYLFRNREVKATYPVAVGRPSWPTALGEFQLQTRVINPQWRPTKNMIRREDIRDDPVPPGAENPVGDRWMGWSAKGFGFHSTTAPETIGQAVSHGCLRLYPESAHAMFDLVKKGDAIYSVYEPILLGERDGRYYLSVFPDIYNKHLVSLARVHALLQSEGLLSAVNMREVTRALKNQDSYPRPISPLLPAGGRKPNKFRETGSAPGQQGPAPPFCSRQTGAHSPTSDYQPPFARRPSKDTGKGVQSLHPLPTPAETVQARMTAARLLAAYHNKQLVLLNAARDAPQLEQTAKQGYLLRPDGTPLMFALQLLQTLDTLAAHASAKSPLILLSLYRPPVATRPHEPHGNGLAIDIRGFDGRQVDPRRPGASVNTVLALLRVLPAGSYRMGLPKPPNTDPCGLLAPPNRPASWPFFPAPVPDVIQIGSVTLVSPWLKNSRLSADRSGHLRAVVLLWENEHGAPAGALGDRGLKKALANAEKRGLHVSVLFPDALDHVHLDVAPVGAPAEPLLPSPWKLKNSPRSVQKASDTSSSESLHGPQSSYSAGTGGAK